VVAKRVIATELVVVVVVGNGVVIATVVGAGTVFKAQQLAATFAQHTCLL